MKKWEMKPVIYSGDTCLDRLKQLKNEKICFVCDPYLVKTDEFKEIMNYIPINSTLSIFSDIIPDPPIETVAAGALKMLEHKPSVLIAIGGGSAIDTAKGMIFTHNQMTEHRINRFIAIPTTSGTGSEVTSASVITDTREKIKYPIFHEELVPDEALLATKLVLSSPKTVTVYSGMDVLTHGLEALVATNRSLYTEALAEKAIELVFTNLELCFKDGKNMNARDNMHQASCLAGLAFDSAGLGVCHALAHQIGAKFKIPHGLANLMLLPHVIKINSCDQKTKELYSKLAIKLGVAQSCLSNDIAVNNLMQAIQALSRKLECPKTLSEMGIVMHHKKEEIEEIVANAKNDVTFQSNPVLLTSSQLKEIIEKII
ncbi:iron-containing alcohol dehydrogenase [Vagococcus carniphilus]|uniref:Iron-containing alcohol dehydrogenase n=1 Tax=Vagococcus carniphilus TaxID=218144 RepID=A0AAW8U7T3_9ENTE|nr:1-propanol dehydrogenase PduQ [Vagococcus carniphilus]MDT2815437.1 iron-containing alcohol dehydrogenase [Vagococcus carniphilus]MDT2833050.1 iron-containing alcohol dehydrogenase [Vagococcus carniphilus]